jgi:tetratricopeptide (TPR) repeat protein
MLKTSSWKGLIIALVAFLIAAPVFAQNYTAAETKSVEKSKALYNKGKYDKAIATINKVLMAHVHDETLWNLRVVYENTRYNEQYSKDISALVKKMNQKGTVTVDFDKLKSTEYRSELIFACYMATLYADHQRLASSVLHDMKIEPSVDTAISDEARDYRFKGDEEYALQNYSAAIRQYEKAVSEDSAYYTATFDIAFCYYKDEKYDKAAKWFQKAINLQPEMLNPRYYLVESHINAKEWQQAYDACIEGMIQYPFIGYYEQMEKICDKLDKTFKRHWMEREQMPSMITIANQSISSEEPWSFYSSAKEKIADYCNDEGIIKKSQSLTEQKYLESYSWEYMLKKSETDDQEFGFARKMQEQGFLDCFTLFSMFHISVWDQYQHLRDNNRAHIKSYIETQLVK